MIVDQKKDICADIHPVVLVSRCLGFEHCRWNGDIIASPYIEKLKKYVNFITVCPEADIGLGVPRKPVRLVCKGSDIIMIQHESGNDCTDEMNSFSAKFLTAVQPIDGFLFKERSPSCGIFNVKLHTSVDPGSAITKGSGLFGTAFKRSFPLLPISSEGHLYSFILREHFYTQIYTLARFRSICDFPAIKNLVEFHARHKLMLMGYNQTVMRQLGKLAANHEQHDPKAIFDDYYILLCKSFVRPPRIVSLINVLMHAMGYFSEKITSDEKGFFLNLLDQYRQKKIPLSTCSEVIKSWIVRFNETYLAQQLFFSPYPGDLVELSDSGK